jgi:hypothetical protein
LRSLLLTRWCGDFDSDEAIVGLMAKHITEGHFPVFFYGQYYMGSLEALVAAAIFWFAGHMNGFLLRLSPTAFYLAFMLVSFLWLDSWHNRSTAIWGTLFLAVPPAALNKWTYVARGGFSEILFLGTLLLLLCQRGLTLGWNSRRVFGVGLVAGLALWTNPLAILYLTTVLIVWALSSTWWPKWRAHFLKLPAVSWLIIGLSLLVIIIVGLVFKPAIDVIYIQRLLIGAILVAWVAWITLARWLNRLKNNDRPPSELYAFWLGLGGILGIAPMIYFFLNPGNATGGRDDFKVTTWQQLAEVWQLHLFEISPALIGLRTYTDSASGGMFLAKIGMALIFAAAIFLFCKHYSQALLDLLRLRPIIPQAEHYLWLLGSLTMGLGLIYGNNYELERLRYFVPMLFVLGSLIGLTLAQFQKYHPAIAITVAIFLWGYYGVTHGRYYQSLTATCPEQQVAQYLLAKQVKGGRAYFQHAYKLTFMSQEEVIVAPYQSRERYEAYSHYVATLPQQTYIFQEGIETELFLSELEPPPHFSQETINGFNIFTFTGAQ